MTEVYVPVLLPLIGLFGFACFWCGAVFGAWWVKRRTSG